MKKKTTPRQAVRSKIASNVRNSKAASFTQQELWGSDGGKKERKIKTKSMKKSLCLTLGKLEEKKT